MTRKPKASKHSVRHSDSAAKITGYGELLEELKSRIREAQIRAALAVNREMLGLYWQIGRAIHQRQEREGWGAAVIERLARDLRAAFPDVQGFSPRNLWRMRALYRAYTRQENVILPPPVAEIRELTAPGASTEREPQILPPVVAEFEVENLPPPLAEITWSHNLVLIEKLDDRAERLWYARKTVEYGWSRNVLAHQIEGGLIHRQGKALTNFGRTLPAPQSDLAAELLKDRYNFDFLQLGPAVAERDVERGLLAHIRDFLLELGVGFALVGSQYPLEVGGQEYRLDLLFFHIRLRCYVVVELKVGAFQPEYAGKMNFYLSAVDDLVREPEHQPTIGLILCKERNRVVAEYSLRGINKPMGVAEYCGAEDLPRSLRGILPTPEELEKELNAVPMAPAPVARDGDPG